jgi:uncharacterized NAD(P)/FAD-binding protein YdhS
MAPEVVEVVDELRANGRLHVLAGRLRELKQAPNDAVDVVYTPRGTAEPSSLRVGAVVNCTGPAPHATALPLVGRLLRRREASLDALGLGLRCDPRGALLDAHGASSEAFFALGALRRGELWESTAIPEIRAQAHALSEVLLAGLRREARTERRLPPTRRAMH